MNASDDSRQRQQRPGEDKGFPHDPHPVKSQPSSGCATFSHPMGEGRLPFPRARDKLIPNPKLKFMEQCREVMRFHRLALRTEEAYLQWIKRFLVFHREKAEMLKPEKLKAKSRNEGWINIPAEGLEERVKEFTANLGFVVMAGLISFAVALKAFNQIENGFGNGRLCVARQGSN